MPPTWRPPPLPASLFGWVLDVIRDAPLEDLLRCEPTQLLTAQDKIRQAISQYQQEIPSDMITGFEVSVTKAKGVLRDMKGARTTKKKAQVRQQVASSVSKVVDRVRSLEEYREWTKTEPDLSKHTYSVFCKEVESEHGDGHKWRMESLKDGEKLDELEKIYPGVSMLMGYKMREFRRWHVNGIKSFLKQRPDITDIASELSKHFPEALSTPQSAKRKRKKRSQEDNVDEKELASRGSYQTLRCDVQAVPSPQFLNLQDESVSLLDEDWQDLIAQTSNANAITTNRVGSSMWTSNEPDSTYMMSLQEQTIFNPPATTGFG